MKTKTRHTLIAAGLSAVLFAGVRVAFADEASAPAAAPDHAAPASAGHARPNPAWRHYQRMARGRRFRMMVARRLGLSEAQRGQIRQLHAHAMADIWAARADEHLTQDQRRERVSAVLEKGRSDFRNLLTPEQREKLDRIETRIRERQERALLGM